MTPQEKQIWNDALALAAMIARNGIDPEFIAMDIERQKK